MKIRSYELLTVPPRWLYRKVETDDGLVGWGEPVIERIASSVRVAVIEMMETIIGRGALEMEGIWNERYRSGFYRGGPILMSAFSGIDQARWDIKGKYY